ncbi:aminotransferase class V-fold PLP-dependent enzyme [Micromonospora maritima]|uniref:aminotransferase class V-fold PLP-dependent enzyme n=1 Tax=Micromonospora maritima TaxID=986711 RepID=UPI0037A1DC8D
MDQVDERCGPYSLAEVRSWFPVTRRGAYLFNGNIAPCAEPVRHAIEKALLTWSEYGDAYHGDGKQAAQQARTLFGELIGVQPHTIASIPNTTTGIHLASRAVNPPPGSNVVVHELSEQGSVFPWLQLRERGVEVRVARAVAGDVPYESIQAEVDERTAAISITHVSMGTGCRLDLSRLSALARDHGAALIVDAAQSAGAVPIDLRATPVDFLAAPTFKWLFGQTGGGFLHVSERWLETPPPIPGHSSVVDSHDVNLETINPYADARRFESGMTDALANVAAAAGLAMLKRVGYSQVHARIATHVTRLMDGLSTLDNAGVVLWTPTDPEHRAGIVALDIAHHKDLHQSLTREGFHVGDWQGHIRIDPAFYNSAEEIDSVLAIITAHAREHAG